MKHVPNPDIYIYNGSLVAFKYFCTIHLESIKTQFSLRMIFSLNFRLIFASLLFTVILQSSDVDTINLNYKENVGL